MPELPEVQTIVNDLIAENIVGSRIDKVSVSWPRTISAMTVPDFCSKLKGLKIRNIWRRGKYIIFNLDRQMSLLVHLRMTGRFQLSGATDGNQKHVHVIMELDDGRHLMFHDTRKFGRFYLVDDAKTFLLKIGPEPLENSLTPNVFEKMLQSRNRHIKPLLLDQSFLAGLGNIYVDEALWKAKIHPRTPACKLTGLQAQVLYKAIRSVLLQALKNAGTALGRGHGNFFSPGSGYGRNYSELKVFKQSGKACSRCATTIQKIVVAQRGTHICPQCQRMP